MKIFGVSEIQYEACDDFLEEGFYWVKIDNDPDWEVWELANAGEPYGLMWYEPGEKGAQPYDYPTEVWAVPLLPPEVQE